jgi:hypothetical protein
MKIKLNKSTLLNDGTFFDGQNKTHLDPNGWFSSASIFRIAPLMKDQLIASVDLKVSVSKILDLILEKNKSIELYFTENNEFSSWTIQTQKEACLHTLKSSGQAHSHY